MKEKQKKNYWNECIMCGCFYCRYFSEYHTHSHSFAVPFRRMWFWFPRFLWRKTHKGIEDKTMRLQLWHGFYIWPLPEEGATMDYWWPKIIKFNYRFLFTK